MECRISATLSPLTPCKRGKYFSLVYFLNIYKWGKFFHVYFRWQISSSSKIYASLKSTRANYQLVHWSYKDICKSGEQSKCTNMYCTKTSPILPVILFSTPSTRKKRDSVLLLFNWKCTLGGRDPGKSIFNTKTPDFLVSNKIWDFKR